jgi:hypothetical protein
LSADIAADKAEAYESGMDDVIAKPLSLERLAATLERWCPDRLCPAGDPVSPTVAKPAGEAGYPTFWRRAAV